MWGNVKRYYPLFFIAVVAVLFSCKKDESPEKAGTPSTTITYDPTPYQIQTNSFFQQHLPPMPIPSGNPMTEQGVALGKKLFYDKTLSGNNNMSCASCHKPENAFSDSPNAITTIDGVIETRNTPEIINVGWDPNLFWDGRAPSLEDQALEPVVNPDEMHAISWTAVANKLQHTGNYPDLFYAAFGTHTIDSSLVVKAIAQFERTLISDDSRMDKYLRGQIILTSDELAGLNLFMTEQGNCFHCHGGPSNPLWTDNAYHDTGLDSVYTDLGRGAVTGNPSDDGKFKTPTLRNLVFTAPYMHDGRFATLMDVINFYSTGIKHSPNLDPNFYRVNQGGAHFTILQKQQLLAFLKSLTDSSYITNSDYQAPH